MSKLFQVSVGNRKFRVLAHDSLSAFLKVKKVFDNDFDESQHRRNSKGQFAVKNKVSHGNGVPSVHITQRRGLYYVYIDNEFKVKVNSLEEAAEELGYDLTGAEVFNADYLTDAILIRHFSR